MKLSPVILENAFVRLDPLAEHHRELLREPPEIGIVAGFAQKFATIPISGGSPM